MQGLLCYMAISTSANSFCLSASPNQLKSIYVTIEAYEPDVLLRLGTGGDKGTGRVLGLCSEFSYTLHEKGMHVSITGRRNSR